MQQVVRAWANDEEDNDDDDDSLASFMRVYEANLEEDMDEFSWIED